MTSILDRKTIDFILFDMLSVEQQCGAGRYQDHDRQSLDAVLDLAQKLSEDELWPHAALSDTREPQLVEGQARILPEAKDALAKLREAGFFAAHADYELGGMQLPVSVNHACNGMMKGANVSTHAYMSLTRAAGNLLKAHGTDWQKWVYMEPMLEGRFFGTMCLSEPDAGSSLADIRTRAKNMGDGTYHLTGSKMWISGGDQDVSENIVHLVLARLPDAPPGVRGISLFAVPKYLVNEDGSLGARNGVVTAGLNHKMGYRGTTNCLLSLGDPAPAIGTLVGKENHGLATMFHMMNEARIGVGIGAAMLGSVGYRYSLNYAQERRQGRTLSNRDPLSKPVLLIEHADVRRMLLRQKALSEGAIALCLYAGDLVDRSILTDDPAEKERLAALLDLLTPVVKSWPSEFGLDANREAIQILGGYGYTREFPVERLYRDNRLNMIHEGTNGIQALDLLGRKIIGNGMKSLDIFRQEVATTLAEARDQDALKPHCARLEQMLSDLTKTAESVAETMQSASKDQALAHASAYLNAFGHFVVAWLWVRMASTAALQPASRDEAFLTGKKTACAFFLQHELPQAQAWLEIAGADTSLLANATAEVF
ncbi:acyl-CoA dehydrogenase [Rhodobacteraceae bacterium (ex Bugula neritina AB1)]|nr:acyl-CoA dehydrogenase [Rhodobacteraceae bacterium (ex Bugula neritina AB1)]